MNRTILYSHPHGWAPVGEMEKILAGEGITISPLERDNRTDGEYNKRFSNGSKSFDLSANYWRANTFAPLMEWLEKIAEVPK